jgi:hypothetical protein
MLYIPRLETRVTPVALLLYLLATSRHEMATLLTSNYSYRFYLVELCLAAVNLVVVASAFRGYEVTTGTWA